MASIIGKTNINAMFKMSIYILSSLLILHVRVFQGIVSYLHNFPTSDHLCNRRKYSTKGSHYCPQWSILCTWHPDRWRGIYRLTVQRCHHMLESNSHSVWWSRWALLSVVPDHRPTLKYCTVIHFYKDRTQKKRMWSETADIFVFQVGQIRTCATDSLYWDSSA